MENKHKWTIAELFEHQENEIRMLTSEISELLAIMHGDGGQHRAKVGTTQAIKDAKELLFNKWQSPDQVASLQSEIDRLKNDLLDALDLKEGNGPTALSMLKGEIDRLKEEKNNMKDYLLEKIEQRMSDNTVLEPSNNMSLAELAIREELRWIQSIIKDL